MAKDNIIENANRIFKVRKVYLLTVHLLTVSLIMAGSYFMYDLFDSHVEYVENGIIFFRNHDFQFQFFGVIVSLYVLVLIPMLNIRRMALDEVFNKAASYLIFLKAFYPKEILDTLVDHLKIASLFILVNLVNIGLVVLVFLVQIDVITLPFDVKDIWVIAAYGVLLFVLITSNLSFIFMKYTKEKGKSIFTRLTETRLTFKGNLGNYMVINIKTLIVPIVVGTALGFLYVSVETYELPEFFEKYLHLILIGLFTLALVYSLGVNSIVRRDFFITNYKHVKRVREGGYAHYDKEDKFVTPSAEDFFGKKREEDY